jgi:flagellar motor protein MotB
MKSTRSWCVLAVALVLVVGLAACKSKRTSRTYAAAPSIAQPAYPPPPSFPQAMPEPAPAPVSESELAAAKDRADMAESRNEDLENQLRVEQDRVATTETRLKVMEDKLAELEAAPPAGPVATPDMDVPAVDDTSRLADDLRARSAADVLREGDMVIVRVTNGFQAGSDLLRQDVQLIQTLNATADALGRFPGATVAVVGHSDTDPINKSRKKWSSNDELSMARAQRVAQVLADNGVDRNRISIDGRGAREPLILPERSRADKARNRRVEIMIRP